jgi:hypothetical protein
MDFERVVVGSAANRLSQVKNRYNVMPFVFCVDVTLSVSTMRILYRI